jgi:hypothetical protein
MQAPAPPEGDYLPPDLFSILGACADEQFGITEIIELGIFGMVGLPLRRGLKGVRVVGTSSEFMTAADYYGRQMLTGNPQLPFGLRLLGTNRVVTLVGRVGLYGIVAMMMWDLYSIEMCAFERTRGKSQ